MSFKEKISDYARSLGFGEVRFANYQTLEKETDLLKLWISNGYNADMKWIENHVNLRNDPRELLENCKSVIVFAHSYNNGIDHLDYQDHGKIARYAMGKDYHKVLKKKLKKIEKFAKAEKEDFEARLFVDSGPVAERDWASISGIGARGKNSLILNKKLGSYFFLSVMLANYSFDEDTPVSDMCGNCTKCIKACPTNAIVEPYIIDSNKCISYQTIENRTDTIPKEVAENMNGWIFGCDICQEVCPWNNHRNILNCEQELYPKKNRTQVELGKLKEMDNDDFINEFAGQPVIRAKLNGMKRNADYLLEFSSNKTGIE